MKTEALVGDDKMYPAPEFRVMVAVLPVSPILVTVKVTVAEFAPAGLLRLLAFVTHRVPLDVIRVTLYGAGRA